MEVIRLGIADLLPRKRKWRVYDAAIEPLSADRRAYKIGKNQVKAAQLVAPRQWEIVDVGRPEATGGTMLVRLEKVGICGSDKSSYFGMYPSYPLAPGATGHEGVGTVVDCPSGKLQPGERVILSRFQQGLFQEYVVADAAGCVRLPAGFHPDVGLMSQLLGTVIHCFLKLGNVIDEDVVVLGQGPVGQLFNATLRNLGARRIIGVDPLGHRLEVSMRMGATDVINPDQEDLLERVKTLTDGNLADIAVEAIGGQKSFDTCTSLLRRNGTMIYFGVPDKVNGEGVMQVRFRDLFIKEIRIITSVGPNPQQDYSMALDWIAQGRLDPRPIITHSLPFEQIQKGFEIAYERPAENRSVKVLLDF